MTDHAADSGDSVGAGAELSVSELARRSGLSVATIKFYIREGLLAPGHGTSRTRASYDDSHLARLRLIRALLEVGKVPLAAVGSVVALIDGGVAGGDQIIRLAIAALGPPRRETDLEGFTTARRDVLALVDSMGWRIDANAPALDMLADALRALRATYGDVPSDALAGYAAVALELAREEFTHRPDTDDATRLVEWAVTGTVVFEQVLAAWRRLAHEDLAHDRPTGPTSA